MSAISAALERDRRVLFLPTTAMDGSTTKGTLSSMGIRLDLCGTFEGLLQEVAAGAGALLLAGGGRLARTSRGTRRDPRLSTTVV